MDENPAVSQLMGELAKMKEQLQTKNEEVVRLEKENQELRTCNAETTMEYDM